MPGTEIDLKIKQRAKFEYEFFVNDGGTPPTGIDITNRTYTSQMRRLPCGPLIATFTFTKKDQTDQANGRGRVVMSLTASDTSKLPASGDFVYDVFQQIGTDDPTCVFYGQIEVEPAITR